MFKKWKCSTIKGGSEAKNTNRILYEIIKMLLKVGIDGGWIQLLETRDDVNEMLKWINILT